MKKPKSLPGMPKNGPAVYVVGVFNHPLSDLRVMGTFPSEKESNLMVKNNAFDIHEGYYRWAVVEKFQFGMYPLCRTQNAMWYRWDSATKKYRRKSRVPSVVAKLRLQNLTIGPIVLDKSP